MTPQVLIPTHPTIISQVKEGLKNCSPITVFPNDSLKAIQHLAIGRGWRKILALSNLKLRQKCLTQKCFSIFHFPPLVHTFFQREGRGKNSSEGPLACLSTATLFTFLLTLQIHFGKQLQSFVFAEILHGKYIL